MRLRLHTAQVVSRCVPACSTDDDPMPASRLEVLRAPVSVANSSTSFGPYRWVSIPVPAPQPAEVLP